MTARRALEWINVRTSKARLVFRYEISDLFDFHCLLCPSVALLDKINSALIGSSHEITAYKQSGNYVTFRYKLIDATRVC